MENSTSFRYFGRPGIDGDYVEIYRTKDIIDESTWPILERLKRDGSWNIDPADDALANEWLKGDFYFEENELTAQEVNDLYQKWSADWPGRA